MTPQGNTGSGTVLVTAATGKTGRRVADRLTELGIDVRRGSRCGTVPFDWADRSTWEPALRGADAAYVNYYPDLAAPGAPEDMRAFGAVADRAGVRRLVLLSGRGEPQAVVAEDALRACGPELRVVRASFFAQNFSEGALAGGVAEGDLVFPAGTTAEPFIDADDLADVMVAVLTDDGPAPSVREVTGPRLLTFAEAAAEIAGATGAPVAYTDVPAPEYARLLTGFGVPAPEAQWLAELFATLLDGHNSSTTDGVREVLGREPKDFADFAKETFGGHA
ncbi:NmrA family transcriptional regulator [Streptomyces sp. t39]|uniref:NmrA family transcriptional regulator n=1 Tax=Streptomyces sp. t39 TaxID=1828156 RepID=UPI0011CE648B|nr:NmrA family transcriptional regulator [Streptomyces sp. t39]TXS57587.1 NmrA family transcriptional regulator [Streptomyces sp. t39]